MISSHHSKTEGMSTLHSKPRLWLRFEPKPRFCPRTDQSDSGQQARGGVGQRQSLAVTGVQPLLFCGVDIGQPADLSQKVCIIRYGCISMGMWPHSPAIPSPGLQFSVNAQVQAWKNWVHKPWSHKSKFIMQCRFTLNDLAQILPFIDFFGWLGIVLIRSLIKPPLTSSSFCLQIWIMGRFPNPPSHSSNSSGFNGSRVHSAPHRTVS